MPEPDKPTSPPAGKKLLDQVSDALRTKHYSYRTEQTYKDWIKRYTRCWAALRFIDEFPTLS